jgi:hypothetical protein
MRLIKMKKNKQPTGIISGKDSGRKVYEWIGISYAFESFLGARWKVAKLQLRGMCREPAMPENGVTKSTECRD